jgi:hypothetical protein
MVGNNAKDSIAQTIGKRIKAAGNVSFENITQIANQTVIKGELFFDEISVDQFYFNQIPEVIKNLAARLNQQRLLVITGDKRVRKGDLAKSIIHFIKTNHPSQVSAVKESVRNFNLGLNIQCEIRKSEESTGFILSDISSKTFGLSLVKLQKIAVQGNHYVIATTDDLKNVWRTETSTQTQSFFYEVSHEEIKNYDNLYDNLSDEESIRQWYYQELNHREQLLAISLSLFDGFYEDQFFASLEQLVEKAWHKRDASLCALDYGDLDKLESKRFFSLSGKNKQEETVQVSSSRQRRLLLKVSWSSHRRQIISALPTLENLVRGSLNSVSSELYGSEKKRIRLRQTIAETISDIGLVSKDSQIVEETLLSLASDENIQVQAVAANALALWRNEEKRELIQDNLNDENDANNNLADQKLFETLRDWTEQAEIISLVDSFVKSKNYESSEEPVDYLRATVALTVGFASEADSFNEMSEKLLQLFRKLVIDKNTLVKNRVLSDTLPRVVRRHTKQIASELRFFLKNADSSLMIAISKSLAAAYQFQPDEVSEILASWLNESDNNLSLERRVTLKEKLLSAAALTCGEIQFDGQHKFNNEPRSNDTKYNDQYRFSSIEDIFDNFKRILGEQLHPFVRSSTIIALGRQAQKNFSQFKEKFQDFTKIITKNERKDFVNILTIIYLYQRRQLSGGDQVITFKSEEYPVWLNSERPLTDVEQAILKWVQNDEEPMAQQVAISASTNFAKQFDREEARQIKKLKNQLDIEQPQNRNYPEPVLGGKPPEHWYLGKLIPRLATVNAESCRTSIRNLLPEGLNQYSQNSKDLNFVLKKWHNFQEPKIQTISYRLKPGILLANFLKWGMVAVSFGVVILIPTGINQIVSTFSRLDEEQQEEAPAIIDSSIILSNQIIIEDGFPTFDQGQLIVRFTENGTSEDRFSIKAQPTGENLINLNGNTILYRNVVVGEFTGGQGVEPFVVNFNSNATPDIVQTLIRNITYDNVADSPELGLRNVEFQVTDGDGKVSNPLRLGIFVAQENQAPKVKVPEHKIATENVPLPITGIGFEDPDSTKNLTVVLRVNEGIISVLNSTEQIIVRNNNNSTQVTLVGNAEKINSILSASDTITYKGSYNDQFSVFIDDGGLDIPEKTDELEKIIVWPSESAIEKRIQAEFKITVNPSNEIPIITLAESQKEVDQAQGLAIGNIIIDDPDTPELKVILRVNQGTLNVKSDVSQGLTSQDISGNQTNQVILSGDLSAIQSTLANPQAITYQGNSDFYGSDTLEIRVDDGGRGNKANIAINVNRLYKPPILRIDENTVPSENSTTMDFQPNATVSGDPDPIDKNVRAGSSTNTEVIFQLPIGSRVRVTDRRDSEGYLWYRIYSYDKQREGWMAGHLVTLDEP